jgi:hypothetical protein
MPGNVTRLELIDQIQGCPALADSKHFEFSAIGFCCRDEVRSVTTPCDGCNRAGCRTAVEVSCWRRDGRPAYFDQRLPSTETKDTNRIKEVNR